MPERLPTAILPERKALRHALRAAGFSDRMTRFIVNSIWRLLVSKAEADAAELREELERLRSSVGGD